MPVVLQTTLLLIASNVFMTYAWYGHLKDLRAKPWYLAAVLSWAIALAEYMLQVPANRIGDAGGLTLPQLKIMQEVITLAVFAGFAVLYLGETLRWNYFAAFGCLLGAVFFIFKT